MGYLLLIGATQALFTALFFITKRKRTFNDRIVAIFMGCVILSLFSESIRLGIINAPELNFLSLFYFSALFGPCVYLYTRSSIDRGFSFSRKILLHLLPFLFLSVLFCFQTLVIEEQNIFKAPPAQDRSSNTLSTLLPKIHFSDKNAPTPRQPEKKQFWIRTGRNIIAFLSLFILLAYVTGILKILRHHKQRITDFYSYYDWRISLRWMLTISTSFAVIYAYVHLISIFRPLLMGHQLLEPVLTYISGHILFIYIFSFFAMKQPRLFADDKTGSDEKKYEKSGLKNEDSGNYLARIEQYMDREKPYLDGELTLNLMADELHIPKHYITQILNLKLNKNFYGFVNEYRLKEAMRRLTTRKYDAQTVLQIAFESGFNSKSVFNSTFKKHTEMTPSQYRSNFFKK